MALAYHVNDTINSFYCFVEASGTVMSDPIYVEERQSRYLE